jgi:excinuclease UvrABC nuclease subunit
VLERALTFPADCEDNFFAEIPAAPTVFLLRGQGEPYVSKTANLRRRLQRLLGKPAEQSKRLNIRERVREIEFTLTGSDFESQFLLYKLLREGFPETYAARLRLRPAPLVKLHLENDYPRASVTTRLGEISTGEDARAPIHHQRNLYYGPFRSRVAADKFASDVLDFFKMRRCVDDLNPDPAFPGCVYSEMKMCLAPCYKGCTDNEYRAEVSRVRAFFDTSGESLARELGHQRERASAQLAFEEAAGIHAKAEKLRHLLSQLPEIVQPIGRLAAIIVQPNAETGRVELFHFTNASLQGPIPFSIEQSGEPQSMESRLQFAISEFRAAEVCSMSERSEHLAILQRWYYRSHRIGEIFFADEKGVWPWRRIVRGVGRVCRGEKTEAPAPLFPVPSDVAPS